MIMSMPFYGNQFVFTQPDGSQLQVRGWGDQHHAAFETLDGFTVVRDPVTGYYQYAAPTPDGEDLRPTGARPGFADPRSMGLTVGLRIAPRVAKARALEGHGLP